MNQIEFDSVHANHFKSGAVRCSAASTCGMRGVGNELLFLEHWDFTPLGSAIFDLTGSSPRCVARIVVDVLCVADSLCFGCQGKWRRSQMMPDVINREWKFIIVQAFWKTTQNYENKLLQWYVAVAMFFCPVRLGVCDVRGHDFTNDTRQSQHQIFFENKKKNIYYIFSQLAMSLQICRFCIERYRSLSGMKLSR